MSASTVRPGPAPLALAALLALSLLCPRCPRARTAPGGPPPAPPPPPARTDAGASGLGGFLLRRTLPIVALGGLAAALTWDAENPDVMARALESSPLEPGMDAGNGYGDGWTIGGGAAATLLAGELAGSPRLRRLGTDLLTSYLASGAVSGIIKLGVNRRRPSGGGLSFPSGHTTAAFSAVPVLARDLGWRAALPALGLAAMTGLGRMEDRRHYLSDVLFGAAIGLAVGDVVARGRTTAPGILDGVVLGPDGVGYEIAF